MASERVLVTGGTGFIASHLIYQLLEKGYSVRTTARNKDDPRIAFLKTFHSRGHTVEVVSANLLEPNNWDAAVSGCTYIIHTASPFNLKAKEADLVKGAVEGTTNVMNAVVRNKESIRRVVVTSSCAAIMYGHSKYEYSRTITEKDWSVEKQVNGYYLSKLQAEKTAWKMAKDHNISMNTICPTMVFGPVLAAHQKDAESSQVLCTLLRNDLMFGMPVATPTTDVRDVAKLHLLAMESNVSNERFLSASDDMLKSTLIDWNSYLTEEFAGKSKYKPAKKNCPNWLYKGACYVHPGLKPNLSMIGSDLTVSNEKSKKTLGMTFRSGRQAMIEHSHSLMRMGVLEPKGYPESEYINQKAY